MEMAIERIRLMLGIHTEDGSHEDSTVIPSVKEYLRKHFDNIPYESLNQCDRILKYLTKHDSISALEAVNELGILRLASRVSDLKRRGYNIVGETKTGKNRFEEKTSFKVYRLIEKEGK